MRSDDEKALSRDLSNLFHRVSKLENVSLSLENATRNNRERLDANDFEDYTKSKSEVEKRLDDLERGNVRAVAEIAERNSSRLEEIERRLRKLEKRKV